MPSEYEQKDNQPLNLAWEQDRHRVLLVFVPSPEDERYIKQQELLFGHSSNMLERDLITFYIFEHEAVSGPTDASAITPKSSAETREEYNVKEGKFAVVLIGKDGGEKERYDAPVDTETLFGVIDAMPMRQEEMKE